MFGFLLLMAFVAIWHFGLGLRDGMR